MNVRRDGSKLFELIWDGEIESVIRLIKIGASIHGKDHMGNDLLNVAVRSGNVELVSLLLSLGMNVNSQNPCDYTPLHCAVLNGDKEMVDFLMSEGADPFLVAEPSGDTPVSLAKEFGGVKL